MYMNKWPGAVAYVHMAGVPLTLGFGRKKRLKQSI